MPKGQPVDPETRSRIVALMAAGELGRNAIARECGVSGPVVTQIARDIGHEFDRTQTELAVAAQKIDLAKDGADLARMLMVEARQALEDLHMPHTVIQFENGHQVEEFDENGIIRKRYYSPGVFREHVIPEPTASDKRNYMTIVGIAVTKVHELTKTNDAAPNAGAISYLDGLEATLIMARAAIIAQGNAERTDPTLVPDKVDRETMLAEFEDVVAAEQAAATSATETESTDDSGAP